MLLDDADSQWVICNLLPRNELVKVHVAGANQPCLARLQDHLHPPQLDIKRSHGIPVMYVAYVDVVCLKPTEATLY